MHSFRVAEVQRIPCVRYSNPSTRYARAIMYHPLFDYEIVSFTLATFNE